MKDKVKYYGNGCPKCKTLLSILQGNEIVFTKEENVNEIIKVAKEHGLNTMPILEINRTFYGGNEAINKAKEL